MPNVILFQSYPQEILNRKASNRDCVICALKNAASNTRKAYQSAQVPMLK